MASVVVVALVMTVAGILTGAFVAISLTIRREDKHETLSRDAPDRTAQSIRSLTGYTRRG